MERTISSEERLRRAEEIYQRRKMTNRSGVRVASSSVNNTKTKLSLFKKMILQLAICAVIYIIFYLIKNTNYIFSDDVIHKTKELLSHDINFGNLYAQVSSFIEENKDKLVIPRKIQEEPNEVKENEKGEENKEQITENKIEDTNSVTNEVSNGGIGGAETNEMEENKTDEKLKKSQMELDSEYIKQRYSFKVPLKGSITSRYGAREKTDIVSANHYGIDIGANIGTAIYAAMEGTVTVASSEGDYRKTY